MEEASERAGQETAPMTGELAFITPLDAQLFFHAVFFFSVPPAAAVAAALGTPSSGGACAGSPAISAVPPTGEEPVDHDAGSEEGSGSSDGGVAMDVSEAVNPCGG